MSQHIIVCSNNPTLVDAATRVLDPHRPRLTVCESGLEVLGAVEVVDADLLILDMQTPGLNGLLLITAVRKLAPSLPIVAVSTTPQEDARAVSHTGVSYATLPSGGSDGPQALAATLADIGEIRGMGLSSGAGSR
ncbi:MAG: response regulator [candidate division NC10 bacterium]|nr:response regulator [candidate division NC10 bacterium]